MLQEQVQSCKFTTNCLIEHGVQFTLVKNKNLPIVLASSCRPVITTAPLLEKESYVARNEKLKRPLSPSLGILASK